MFIPRHPVVENQFCKYGATEIPGGAGNVVAYAGSVVYLDETADESMVLKMAHGVTSSPFGFCMQKVKTGYHSVHPVGMMLAGDLGSSDAIAQPVYNVTGDISGTQPVPVGTAHLGIWDTVHYTCLQTVVGTVDADANMKNGQSLFAAADQAKVTNSTVASDGDVDTHGERCSAVAVARVVKGASVAKCTSNVTNSTLYPIRIKLLV
jgi:hypothetical protein